MNHLKKTGINIITIVVLSYTVYVISERLLTGYLLKYDGQQTKGVIIDEKNTVGNNHLNPRKTYSYLFYVNGRAYTKNSKDLNLQIGDSVDIKYVKYWPYWSHRISPLP
jgi:hypothetical protein